MEPWRPTRRCALALPAVLWLALASPAHAAPPGPADALIAQASDLAYNLDHDEAVALLRRGIERYPNEPAVHRALASTLWLNMLFRRGAVTVDHYLGPISRSSVDLAKPPPELDAEFRKELQLAITLAERRVAAAPNDAQAQYDLGAAVAIQATYVATVEGKLLAGFRAARRGYDEHEKVLKMSPSRKDAELTVGTYRYIVSTLSFPMRVMAYVVGFGGGRDRGLRMLEEAASTNNDARADALFALILMYNRERRYDDAMRVLQELRGLYPRNRLVVLEAGSTALRAGRPQQAEALLSDGIAALAHDRRVKVPGEEALWHYKRGVARVALGRSDEALADLRVAIGPSALLWVSGRAHVELARLALRHGDRQTVAAETAQAQSLCEKGNDPVCVEDAKKVSRSAHGG